MSKINANGLTNVQKIHKNVQRTHANKKGSTAVEN